MRSPVKKDFQKEWMDMLNKGIQGSFYINPKPSYTSDCLLNQKKIKRLFEDSILPYNECFQVVDNSLFSRGSKLSTWSFY